MLVSFCNYRLWLCLVIGPLLNACAPAPSPERHSDAKPNIVLILIDDMGFNDLGANGNASVRTPNLDALAAQGVLFTRHYVDSTCSPTRIGVMTGNDPIVHGFTANGRGISPETVTLPEALRVAGYNTHHIGKWHIGHTTQLAWPNQQGFDTFFGFLSQFLLRGPQDGPSFKLGRPTYTNPWLQKQNERPQQHMGQLSEILTRRAVALIDAKKDSDEPWFLNFWTYAPHTPIEPMAEFANRHPDTPEGHYRAMLEQVDDTVGRVVESLERNKLADNTLLIVASDNGGTNRQIDNNAPYFGTKATFFEGGVRTPLIIRWPGNFPAGLSFDKTVSNFDYFPTISKAAGASVPENLPGRDLAVVVANQISLDKPLFWESSNSTIRSWAILSPDGRWRMSQYFIGEPVLNDLQAKPSGGVNVLDDHPKIADSLHADYISWRHQRRVVPINYTQSNDRGHAILTGSSLQRGPGFGGYTFAIGVTPTETHRPKEGAQTETIVEQEGQWSLKLKDNKLLVDISGIVLEAKSPAPGQCSRVILASHFDFSGLYPKKNRAEIQLYVNEELVDSRQIEQPDIPGDDVLRPTYIGRDAIGQFPFRGSLGRPIIYNERLVFKGERGKNSIGLAVEGLCS